MVLVGLIGVYQQSIILYKTLIGHNIDVVRLSIVHACIEYRKYISYYRLIRLSFFAHSESSNNNINKNCDWKSIETKCCRLRYT